jgi:hypothetical protein
MRHILSLMDTDTTKMKHIGIAVLYGVLLVLLLGASFYFYTAYKTKKETALHPRTKEELAVVQENFMKNFRPGCPLTSRGSFLFKDGVEITGYFANCTKGMTQRTYAGTIINGRYTVLEKLPTGSSSVPIITVYGKLSDVSSSTLVLQEMAKITADRDKEVKSMTVKQQNAIEGLTPHFGIVGSYVVLYQIPVSGAYFDETSLTITMSTSSVKTTKATSTKK